MDWDALRDYQLTDLDLAIETVRGRRRSAGHMTRKGFDWRAFAESPALAYRESRRWLAWKKLSGGRNSLHNYEYVVNDVAKFMAFRTGDRAFLQACVEKITEPEYGHPDPYAPHEIQALQAYGSGSDDFTTKRRRAMVLLSSFCGARRGEQSRFDIVDLDLDALTLHQRLPGKHGRKRKLPIPSLFASPTRAITAYLEERARRFPRADALWLTQDGTRFSPATLGRETFHMSQELGFAVSFNRFRRSWNTTVRRCGCPKETAKYLLGHQGKDATDHYWEPDVEDIRHCLHKHEVPGFIRSREVSRVATRPPLPVPSWGADGRRDFATSSAT